MTALSGREARAVLIGTATHDPASELPDVPSAARSVYAMRECLIEACGMDPDNIEVRIDGRDSGELHELIDSTARSAGGVFLLYYVGHGLVDGRNNGLHLALPTSQSPEKVYSGQTLPFDVVQSSLVRQRPGLDSPTSVIILDCCYAGRANARRGATARTGFEQSKIRGAYVLAASGENEAAWAPDGERYTAFSGALMHLLRDGSLAGPPEWTLETIYEALARELVEQGAPPPRASSEDRAGKLALAPNRQSLASSPPPIALPTGISGWDEDLCPYNDLRAYDVDEYRRFFGRRDLITELVRSVRQRLTDPGLQVVIGPSGTGKSSLLRAGMLNSIASGELGTPASSDWPQIVLTPGSDPVARLAAFVTGHTIPTTPKGEARVRLEPDVHAVIDRLIERPDRFSELLRSQPATGTAGAAAVLVVDQFEELFTECDDPRAREVFVGALAAAAGQVETTGNLRTTATGNPAGPDAVVVICVRSDAHGACVEYVELRRALDENAITVGPMSKDQMLEAIEKPAEAAGLYLEGGLAEAMLRDADTGLVAARAEPASVGVLPLLSHALAQTWVRRQVISTPVGPRRALTHAGYEGIGRISGALAASAEQVFTSLSEIAQHSAPRVFLSLVYIGPIGESLVESRRRASREDMFTSTQEGVEEVLTAFIGARLVTADEDTVELAHDALLNAWPRLRTWIDQNTEWIRATRALDRASVEWEQPGDATAGRRRSRERLYLGWQLENWRTIAVRSGHTDEDLSPAARRFLAASIRGYRHRRRIRRSVIVGLVVLTLVASGASAYAFNRSRVARHATSLAVAQRNDANSRAVASEANDLRTTDPGLARQLSVAGYRISPTVEATSSLLSTQSMPTVTRAIDHDGATYKLAVLPDRTTIATVGADGTVRLWGLDRPRTPKLLTTIRAFQGAVLSVAVSPNGRLLAAGDENGAVGLWDISEPSAPKTVTRPAQVHEQAVEGVTFSADSQVLATGSSDNTIKLWNVDRANPSFQLLSSTTAYKTGVTDLSFSPVGRTLLSGGDASARVWDASKPKRLRSVGATPSFNDQEVNSIAFAPGGRQFAVATADHIVRIWTLTAGGQLRGSPVALAGHQNDVYALAFNRAGDRLASGGNDNTVRIWSLANHHTIQTLYHPESVQGIAFLGSAGPDVATVGNDGLLRTWSLNGQVVLTGQESLVSTVVSPDGALLATGDLSGSVRLWDIRNPAEPKALGTNAIQTRGAIQHMSFGPRGEILSVPGDDGSLRLWNISSPSRPKLAGVVPSHKVPVYATAFSPNGGVLAVGLADGTAELWDVEDSGGPRLMKRLPQRPGEIFDLAFSPDGTELAVAGRDRRTVLYDVRDPYHARTVGAPLPGGKGTVLGVAFSPDGGLLATADEDGGITLWRMAARRAAPLTTLTNAGGPAISVAISPAGTVAAGNADGTIWLWRLTRGYPVLVKLNGHPGGVYSVAFLGGGRWLATGGTDATAILWDMDPTKVIRQACSGLGAAINQQQWKLNVPGVKYSPPCGQD